MAIVLTHEESLLQKKRGIAKESDTLGKLVYFELAGGLLLTLIGIWRSVAADENNLLIGGCILLFLAIGHWVKIRDNHLESKNTEAGRSGERLVTKILKRELSDRYYIINDANIEFGRRTAQIDHLIICPRGLFVLETKNWRGKLEGDEKEYQWKQYRTEGAAPVFLGNPTEQNQRHIDVLRSYLTSKDVPESVELINVIVMTNKYSSWHIENQTVPLIEPNDLSDYICMIPGEDSLDWETIQLLIKLLSGQVVEDGDASA